MAKRKLYVSERPKEDESTLGRITTKVKPVVVEQIGVNPPYAIVQASGFSSRDPRYVNEERKLRKALLDFEPTIYSVPEGQRWCSHGHWTHLHNFHTRGQGKLWTICKTCRNELERRAYAARIEAEQGREVRTYRRAA